MSGRPGGKGQDVCKQWPSLEIFDGMRGKDGSSPLPLKTKTSLKCRSKLSAFEMLSRMLAPLR